MPMVRVSEDTKKRLERTNQIMVHKSLDETIRWNMGLSKTEVFPLSTKELHSNAYHRGLKMQLVVRPSWRALTYDDFPKGDFPSGEGVYDVIYRNIEIDKIRGKYAWKSEEEQNTEFFIQLNRDTETLMEHGRLNYVCDVRPVYAINLTVDYREFICLYSLYPKRAKILRGVSLHPTTDYGH